MVSIAASAVVLDWGDQLSAVPGNLALAAAWILLAGVSPVGPNPRGLGKRGSVPPPGFQSLLHEFRLLT